MTSAHQRSIFASGAYLEQFRPEDRHNPFRGIYARKRRDVLGLVTQAMNEKLDGTVLDLGGGMGRIAVPIAKSRHVILADLSPSMLDHARATANTEHIPAGQLETVVCDASQPLPFADASFDTVVCLDLLVHLPDPAAAVREIARVLKPGGVTFIDATNSVPLWVFAYPRYVGKRPGRWIDTLRHGGVLPEWSAIVHHMRHATFTGWLRSAGLHVEQGRSYGPVPLVSKWFLAAARKPA